MRKCNAVLLAVLALVMMTAVVVEAHGRNGRSRWRPPVRVQATALSDGLVAYWKLDEASGIRADTVGGNALINTRAFDAGSVPGVIGNAVKFEWYEHEAVLSAPDAPALRFANDAPWTFAFWWQRGEFGGSTIFAKSGEFSVNVQPDTRRIMVGFGGNTAACINCIQRDNAFHLLVFRFDGVDTLTITVDATVTRIRTFGSIAAPGPGGFFLNPAVLGSATVDEMGKWNRLLTNEEVAALYNGGAGVSLP